MILNSLHQIVHELRRVGREVAYGVNAGNAIRHGLPVPPAPAPSRPPADQLLGKDARMAAYLEGREVRWQNVYSQAIRAAGPDPRQRLLAVFDALHTAVTVPSLKNTTLADASLVVGPAAARVVEAHRSGLRSQLAELSMDLGAADPGVLADSVDRLVHAAVGQPGDSSAVQAIATARDLAAELIGQAETCGHRGAA
jgi:hypothetical protein